MNVQLTQSKRFCVNCRNHGLKNLIVGHKKLCKFSSCRCYYCHLTLEAKVLSLQERKTHRMIDKEHKVKKTEKEKLMEKIENCEQNQSTISADENEVKFMKNETESFGEMHQGNESNCGFYLLYDDDILPPFHDVLMGLDEKSG